MVFQSFALFPWLTVLQNVELGLEAIGIDAAERRRRALAAIDLIGLDGFESAYPKELSGGIRSFDGNAPRMPIRHGLKCMPGAGKHFLGQMRADELHAERHAVRRDAVRQRDGWAA